jgi:hypothetical protein
MRTNITRAVVGALFASLCGGAYAQSVGAGGGADAGASVCSRPGAGASSKAGPGAPAAGAVTDSSLAGARARTTESATVPALNQTPFADFRRRRQVDVQAAAQYRTEAVDAKLEAGQARTGDRSTTRAMAEVLPASLVVHSTDYGRLVAEEILGFRVLGNGRRQGEAWT